MNSINSIAIVGGGTSGWSAAAYITNNLPNCKVTVIDKEISTPIGVGEATILSFKPFMEACGFDYWDWLNNIDATSKAGILYPDWIKEGNKVWHPFNTSATVVDGLRQYEMWTHNRDLEFKRYAITSYDSAVIHNTVEVDPGAFHIDCIKYVGYIKHRIQNRFIDHIPSSVKEVIRDGKKVTGLILENDQQIKADLYIDCTGFLNLLTESPVKNDLYGRLFCNTAQSCHVEYNDRSAELHPYTKAVATDVGWIWVIPTRSRIGSGIVYDKNCVTDKEAKNCLQNYWNELGHTVTETTTHKWNPYYKNNVWEENVVSVGLSAGFIEPLESTGLALIHLGITQLVDKIKYYNYSPVEVSRYNLEMITAFEDVIDFVSMHYSYTERDSKFWNHVRDNYQPSERLQWIIDNHINTDYLNKITTSEVCKVFSPMNYALWLEQLGYKKRNPIVLNTDVDVRTCLIQYADVIEAYAHTSYSKSSAEVEKYENYWQSQFRPL